MRVRGMGYLWTLCMLLLPVWSVWGQPSYTVTDLGSMMPLAINEDGVIVGSASIAGCKRRCNGSPASRRRLRPWVPVAVRMPSPAPWRRSAMCSRRRSRYSRRLNGTRKAG